MCFQRLNSVKAKDDKWKGIGSMDKSEKHTENYKDGLGWINDVETSSQLIKLKIFFENEKQSFLLPPSIILLIML